MTSKAYVFIEGLADKPVICAEFRLNTTTNTGRFRYGKSYLARDDAFPLDPIHLPLSNAIFDTELNKGVFGVLADAGADSWGRKLITQLRKTKPQNELEFLIAGAPLGVGALSFSLSRENTKSKQSRNSIDDIKLLIQGKNAILAAETVSEEVKKAFTYGISMGGARPKTVLMRDGQEYLVKFNRPDDLFNVCRVEYATMTMLRELTDSVAQVELLEGSEDLLLVKRFDRISRNMESYVSHHFISANSLLLKGKVTEASGRSWYSYGQLAEVLRKYSANANDGQVLFIRMVFNILIGNTDDHARNHAMLYCFEQRGWHLSPAYDVLPVNNSRQHSMGIGDSGREGSVENALSQSKRFGLPRYKAEQIITQVRELVREWPVYMQRAGVQPGDIERLKGVIPL